MPPQPQIRSFRQREEPKDSKKFVWRSYLSDWTGADLHKADSGCFYATSTGKCWNHPRHNGWPTSALLGEWQGRKGAARGDKIGLLFDIDASTMTVFKNGTRLGTMPRLADVWERQRKPPADTGAWGARGFVWAVSMYAKGDCTRIQSKPLPVDA